MTQAFPGRILKRGETDARLVRLVQRELARRGYGPFHADAFDGRMVAGVKLFQAQNVDAAGNPLAIDGEIGPFTWGSLFGPDPAVAAAPNPLLRETLAVAAREIGVTEEPPNSNRGLRVNEYLQRVGIPPGWGGPADRAWCAAFVYWCLDEAARSLGRDNPAVRTAGVLEHWRRAKRLQPRVTITRDEAMQAPELVPPGAVFVHDYRSGKGHMGLVESLRGGQMVTIEGNVAPGGDPGREGLCVARVDRRRLTDERLAGFIVYGP